MKLEIVEIDPVRGPVLPNPMPDDPTQLIDLMDQATNYARKGQGVTVPAFDHGMTVFSQLKARYDLLIAGELARAHGLLSAATQEFETATSALKRATWFLAGVTVLLGIVEITALLHH